MIHAADGTRAAHRPAAVVAERGLRHAAAAVAYAATDEVQLSETAKAHVDNAGAPIREDLVRRVRQEIADGSYISDAKLDAVVDRLHRELFGE